jgi:hypothetical protein
LTLKLLFLGFSGLEIAIKNYQNNIFQSTRPGLSIGVLFVLLRTEKIGGGGLTKKIARPCRVDKKCVVFKNVYKL